ncbi:MAG: DNA translocase FtsK 4TM domain-containing protein [Anaerolineae bacterium]|jgi:S-DNA-T family DNA segregation ATPase FtsK/SpoIIIE
MTKRSSRRKKSSRRRRRKPQFQINWNAVLDILGYLLLIIALFTLLALVSVQRGAILGPWVGFLSRVFGWGVYAMPLLIGGVGFFLAFRRFGDRIPRPQPEQVVGVFMLFASFLITAHFLTSRLIATPSGNGGGVLGAWMAEDVLVSGLGGPGTALVVSVLWMLSVTFTFGISPADMARGAFTLIQRLRCAVSASIARGPKTQEPDIKAPQPSKASAEQPAPQPAQATAAPHLEPVDEYVHPSTVAGGPWRLPDLEAILEPGNDQHLDEGMVRQQSRIIEETLASLGAPVAVREINRGPVVTQFGVEPLVVTNSRGDEKRVKVSKISSLSNDLALALSAKTLRVEAPIPNKGLVGIEVPNQEVTLVALRDVMESEAWEETPPPLRIGLGQAVSGQPYVADLTAMPHLLIAGTTGSGKSVCINAILTALLLQRTPEELKLLMVDPKRVELTQYNGIPHLLVPVVVDMERVEGALKWVLREMDGRYRRFAEAGAREIADYNARIAAEDPETKRMPYIVVVVDELADLMMLAPQETERAICRLAQMARATGIHLIIATQRPSVDVVTGLIKANFPTRIAFAVASSVDSRVILDTPGAEQLLGRGDMLFVPPEAAEPIRLQGSFVSDMELQRLVQYWKGGRELETPPPTSLTKKPSLARAPTLSDPVEGPLKEEKIAVMEFEDDLLPDALEILLAENRASISLLQRRLRIGYTRSARIVDLLGEVGAIGPPKSGGQARDVHRDVAEELLRQAGKR